MDAAIGTSVLTAADGGLAGAAAVFGRLHPAVVHVPIGVFVALLVLEVLTWFLGLDDRRRATGVLAWLTAIAAAAAAATGFVLDFEGGHDEGAVADHRNAALAFTAAALLTAVLHARAARRGGRGPGGLYIAGLVVSGALLLRAGHFGGSLTHGDEYLTAPLRGAESAPAEQAPEGFRIVEARCGKCHLGGERKGKLSLESRASILTGGKSGPAVDAATPAESLLLRRILLGLDEKGHMPPKGKPQLTPEEVETLAAWVLAGTPGTSGANAGPASGAGVAPAPEPRPDPKAVAALRDRLVHVKPMAADETKLWIDFAAPAGRLGEAEIAELLTPLAEHVAELSLNRAAAGDAVLALAATMPLTRLELRETGVGDAAVLKLAGHATLETLVLTQTGVTDACVDALAGMPALKRVYVWGSRLTPEGVARLRRERPGLAVDAGDAPAAAPLATEEPPKLTKGAAAAPALAPPGSAPVNTVCPVSGSPVNVKYTIVFEGRLVGFCCPNCPAKFWAKPDDYASKLGK